MTIIPLHATGVSFSGFGATYQLVPRVFRFDLRSRYPMDIVLTPWFCSGIRRFSDILAKSISTRSSLPLLISGSCPSNPINFGTDGPKISKSSSPILAVRPRLSPLVCCRLNARFAGISFVALLGQEPTGNGRFAYSAFT